jgi:hypothetical protein
MLHINLGINVFQTTTTVSVKQTDGIAYGQAGNKEVWHGGRQGVSQSGRQSDGQTGRHADRQTGRQADSQADWQIEKQAFMANYRTFSC